MTNRLTYIGHATVLIELDGVRLLTALLLRHRIAHLRRRCENFVHSTKARRIRRHIRENREHAHTTSLEVCLVEMEDKCWGTIGAINENCINAPEHLARQCPLLPVGVCRAQSN